MRVEVQLADESGQPYRALIRPGTERDRRHLVKSWRPVLSRGPEHWLDREWAWEQFGAAELAFPNNPEWLVLTDELEREARGDVLGVLVTTVPVSAAEAALTDRAAAAQAMLWVEYIAIAPSLRKPDCPPQDRRVPFLKAIGVRLMLAAIMRSEVMQLGGRIGLHAEGTIAYETYTRWNMRELGKALHPAGGRFPVFFGDATWAREYREQRTTERPR